MAADINYKDFSEDDFIKDEFFQHWVYHPDAESTRYWEDFLAGNPEKARMVEEARRFLKLLDFHEGDVFQSKINALKNRIDFAIDHPGKTAMDERGRGDGKAITRQMAPWLQAAASLALLAVIIYMAIMCFPEGNTSVAPMAMHEQTTANGERTVIYLEDGTKVWLNVASKMRYPASFDGNPTREVYLEGEAFFDVAENKAQPFIVRTQAVQIKVLGTSFNVKSYDKEDEIQTTLVKGKVTVESIDDQPKVVTLAPNQVATYHKESKKIVLNNQQDTDALAGWKDGRLIFDNRPLSEIVVALERWYDVKIKVEDQHALKCHFSAKIENLTLNEVLELFKASDGIEYTIDGQDVAIQGVICAN